MSARGRWLLSAAVLAAALVVPELLLRAFGFQYASGVQFGYPDPTRMAFFAPDPRLFWKLKPAADPAHVRADVDGNAHGFQGADPAIPKPAGTYRMLYLGDSCTFQGYPWRAESRMRELKVPADRRAETVSLAIPGYTSFQGLRAAQDYGLELDPDVVFVYFGWNDHWAAYGAIDSKKVVARPQPLGELRIVQATQRLLGRKRKPLDESRVMPDEYRENLSAIVELFATRKIPVVFLTAPTTFYALGVPQKLVDDRFAKSGEEAIRLHREYNAIVREVAAKSGARLLDLEKECEASPNLKTWFLPDGIHFSPVGRDWLGDRIARYVRDELLRE